MRKEIRKFYENLIDDVEDETIKDEMLDRFEAIDDELYSLEHDIELEIEKQEYEELPSSYELEQEFMYQNRMC